MIQRRKMTNAHETVYHGLVGGVVTAFVVILDPDLALLWKLVWAVVGVAVVHLVVALLLPPRRDQSRAKPQEDRL